MASVILVEDDPVLARAVSAHLEHAGHVVTHVADGELALRRVRTLLPDLAVVDLMIPGRDGWSLIEAMRREALTCPVVVMSARSAEHDKVHTLGLGADDYLVKPISMRELVARIDAALRRVPRAASSDEYDPIRVGDLQIDPGNHRAFVHDGDRRSELALTRTEFRLVVALARAPGQVLTREDLLRTVWQLEFRHRDRTVDGCVRKVREKLARHGVKAAIHTHAGVGYRLDASAVA